MFVPKRLNLFKILACSKGELDINGPISSGLPLTMLLRMMGIAILHMQTPDFHTAECESCPSPWSLALEALATGDTSAFIGKE